MNSYSAIVLLMMSMTSSTRDHDGPSRPLLGR
jgi:hypothetical protein